MNEIPRYAEQLKEASRVVGARWAVWLWRDSRAWEQLVQYGLSKARLAALDQFIHQPGTSAWLSGALSSGRGRSRQVGLQAKALGCQRLYAFPNLPARCALLVGADGLDKSAEGFLRAIALIAPEATQAAQDLGEEQAGASLGGGYESPLALLPPSVELEVSYNPEGVLENILQYLVGFVPCDSAILSIRFGDIFRVEAAWNCPPGFKGSELRLDDYKLLAAIVASRQGLIDEGANEMIDQQVMGSGGSWMGVPLVIGQRVIGHLAFSASQAGAFSNDDLHKVSLQANRLVYLVENAMVFAEAARYLQQLALLNDLASAASLGVDMHEVASRVLQRLNRTFHTELAGVFLLSADGRTLRDYGTESRSKIPLVIPVSTSLVGRAVETGLPERLRDVHGERDYLDANANVRSALAVPLKYRGRVIGALALESTESNAFSQSDEQLLVVIASHLAGLFENMRLNEETRERAQKLQDSVRQLQAVRETALDIAGDLDLDALLKRAVNRCRELVGAKGAELGLLDEAEQVVNVLVSETPWNFTKGEKIPIMAGVAGRVVAFGETLVVSDYNAWNGRLHPEREAPFRSVAGVPLKYQGKVIGALTLIDDRPDWIFRPEDLQTLELLAPQMTVFIRNARLYQELQERIRAQRLAENHLIRSARLAAVGEMAAGVAHELNNPLTTVTGFVELVLEELPEDSPMRADLQLVLQEAQRARGVVRRMLDFSRPVENQRIRTDINELICDVLTLVNHLARTGGVDIVNEPGEGLPWVSVDPAQIKQVLLNLIHNAIQAMPHGGEVTIRTGSQQRDDRTWQIVVVRDTGVGMAPETMERIFEPFFTTRPAGKGTGLGLSVSYGIVSDHGGFIEVESQTDKGSSFTIFLPVESDEA